MIEVVEAAFLGTPLESLLDGDEVRLDEKKFVDLCHRLNQYNTS